jgi:hypothetical protein
MRKIIIIIAALAVFAVPAHSQKPQPPKLTEIEQLKIENFNLKFNQLEIMKHQIEDQEKKLQADYQAFSLGVSSEHPGYMLDQQGNLIPAPKPAEAPKAPEKPSAK